MGISQILQWYNLFAPQYFFLKKCQLVQFPNFHFNYFFADIQIHHESFFNCVSLIIK